MIILRVTRSELDLKKIEYMSLKKQLEQQRDKYRSADKCLDLLTKFAIFFGLLFVMLTLAVFLSEFMWEKVIVESAVFVVIPFCGIFVFWFIAKSINKKAMINAQSKTGDILKKI